MTTSRALGNFVLGRDALGGSHVVNRRKRITGSGKRFSMIGKNSNSDEDFKISKFLLYLMPSDERVSN